MVIKLFHRKKDSCAVKEIILSALEYEMYLKVHNFLCSTESKQILKRIQAFANENNLKLVNSGFYEVDFIKLPPTKKIKDAKSERK